MKVASCILCLTSFWTFFVGSHGLILKRNRGCGSKLPNFHKWASQTEMRRWSAVIHARISIEDFEDDDFELPSKPVIPKRKRHPFTRGAYRNIYEPSSSRTKFDASKTATVRSTNGRKEGTNSFPKVKESVGVDSKTSTIGLQEGMHSTRAVSESVTVGSKIISNGRNDGMSLTPIVIESIGVMSKIVSNGRKEGMSSTRKVSEPVNVESKIASKGRKEGTISTQIGNESVSGRMDRINSTRIVNGSVGVESKITTNGGNDGMNLNRIVSESIRIESKITPNGRKKGTDSSRKVSESFVVKSKGTSVGRKNPMKSTRKVSDDVRHKSKVVVPYNKTLLTLSKMGNYPAAENLLYEMMDDNGGVPLNINSWNTVLRAYAVSMRRSTTDAKTTIERAETFLRKMIKGEDDQAPNPNYPPPKPDTSSFNTIISLWSRHPDSEKAAAKSEHWLRYMQREIPSVRPNVYSYTAVIIALSRNRGDAVVTRVLALLKEMELAGLVAYGMTYQAAIDTMCLNLQMEPATQLFETILASPKLRPDATTYTTLLNGWTRYVIKSSSGAQRIEAIEGVKRLIRQIKQVSRKRRKCVPDAATFTSLLNFCVESRQPDSGHLAYQVLDEMRQYNMMPETIHYNTVMLSYCKSNGGDKDFHIEKLWKEMLQLGIPCDSSTYRFIFNAAARSFGDEKLMKESLQTGLDAFDRLQKDPDCQPTALLYTCYFGFLRRAFPRNSSAYLRLLKSGFDMCCQQGCLNNSLLLRLSTATEKEAKHIFEGNYENRKSLSTLPPEWSANAEHYESLSSR